ncbi:hypothetical protein CHLNCDRAFT_141352 [Chlorella variabilis]|uniref:Glutamine amidotransferase domain-containing protein n=1 Tax=Chlorella variabilis TaxID=554065 RepID=E1ZSP7_CHLVA|nr:hypothetical protein CHLNCDRAFT_141352 [Chlorella variabilis]EFN51189.1 hypothetical protein CHLNCDRAFT_141352 [Chlorella variabilis]|eukprot:XP_005843291.1 hypothetical protein CHLNCDRAFT_141352 [Chlorella variabilis]
MARKFAILVAGEPDQAVIDRKGTFEQMFLDLLRDEGRQEEEWQLFFAFQGQLPSEQELDALSGVVITGSVADAFGDEDWLRDLRRTVRAAMDQRKQVLGVCFGHQLVGVELGARVGRAGCWEVGAREVAAASGARRALQERGAGWAGLLPDRLCLHEFHQDQARRPLYRMMHRMMPLLRQTRTRRQRRWLWRGVLEVPQGATLLASSERCPVEMFAVGSHVLCIQGHPEFDGEVVRLLAQPRLEKMGAADVARMEESMAKLAVGEQAAQLQRLCRAFLKGG